MELPVAVVVVFLLVSGLLLSRVRFCMVAAVIKASEGDWSGAKVITSICLVISGGLIALGVLSGRPTMQLQGGGSILFGGLLFGLAAVWNRGCFIGTTLQLSDGDLSALFAMAGWIAGFRILASTSDPTDLGSALWRQSIAFVLLSGLICCVSVKKHHDSTNPIQWRSSMGCGLMMAMLDNDHWAWAPSALASTLAHPISGATPWAGLLLITGMVIGSVYSGRFAVRLPRWSDCWRFPWGIGMAMGAALAGGGNDSQMLRFLPGGSPHAWLAVPAMVSGALVTVALSKPARR
jgi:hypothetical protein